MMRVKRDPTTRQQLVVAHPADLSAGVDLRVASEEAAVVIREGQLVAVLETGEHTLPATTGQILFVSLAPVAGIPVVGTISAREHGHLVHVPFQGACGLACDHPKKLFERLLSEDPTLQSGIAPLLRAALGAVSEVVQKLVDKREIRTQDLPRAEVAAAVLDRAVVPGRGALAAYGTSFLGFQRGSFEGERAPESGRAAVIPQDLSATPYPTSVPSPEPTANLPQRRTDFRETPYPLSVPFARDPNQRVAAVPSSNDAPPSSRRVQAFIPPGQWVGARLLRVEGERCEVVLDGRSDHVWLQRDHVRA